MKIAVIGVGQSLRGDDSAGLEAVRQWRENFPETSGRAEVRIEVVELPGLALMDLLLDADAAVLVDALERSSAPGSIHRIDLDQLSSFAPNTKSAHGWGIAETIQLDRQLRPGRQSRVLRFIGIEAEQMNIGETLSPAVRRALPTAAEAIEAEVNELL